MSPPLSVIQNTLLQSAHVRFERYRPSSSFVQTPKVPRKRRVSIPTAKQLASSKHPPEPFNELPDGADVDETDWKCAGVGDQPVLELPPHLRKLMTKAVGGDVAADLYTTQYEGTTGVWYAVFFGLDQEFLTRTFASQQKCVRDVKQQMSIELDDFYQKHKYRQYGYRKADMDSFLSRADEYHTTLGHFLTDFLDINALVLKDNRQFHWLGRFDESRRTLVLHHQGAHWGAVVHPDQESHLLDKATVDKLTQSYAHQTAMDASQKHKHLVMDANVLAQLKKQIKAMKIRELQDKALELELLLTNDNGKKKLKKELQVEIYTQLTGCEGW